NCFSLSDHPCGGARRSEWNFGRRSAHRSLVTDSPGAGAARAPLLGHRRRAARRRASRGAPARRVLRRKSFVLPARAARTIEAIPNQPPQRPFARLGAGRAGEDEVSEPNALPEIWIRQVTDEVARQLGESPDDRRGASQSSRECGCELPGFEKGPDQERLSFLKEHGVARIGSRPGIGPIDAELASLLDHTLLKPDATEREILTLCEEAHVHGFATVCVQPIWVPLCARVLEDSPVRVCTVIGFPHGANRVEVIASETEVAIAQGAR